MLTLNQLSLRYGRHEALSEVTASSGRGRIIALVGRNGSGKSTLLRLCAGLLAPTGGRVEWDGCDLRCISAGQRARRVAYVSQRPQLSIALTVRESIGLGEFARRISSGRACSVDEAIDEMQLAALADRPFHDLSAGEQQRALIARALVQHQCDGLLALDEPFSNLDPGEVSRAANALRGRACAGGLVVVAVHDLPLADQLADEVWWLERGKLIVSGAPAHVLTVERLRTVFGSEFARSSHGLHGLLRSVTARSRE